MNEARFSYLLQRGVAEVISEPELVKLLESGRPLRLKQGFDPSRPDIHLGHVVGLRKLRQFQEMGHQVILIVGDWTAQIGDPSGESITRPMLTHEEVKSNAETYMKQFFKVVDREKTQVKWQSEWFGKFGLSDVIRLTSRFTVAQFLARDDFNRSTLSGTRIWEARPTVTLSLPAGESSWEPTTVRATSNDFLPTCTSVACSPLTRRRAISCGNTAAKS